MATQPRTATVSISVIVAAVSLIGGMLGILKSCNDELEAKMLAKQQLGAMRQDILEERVKCAAAIERLNEEWHERTGK